MPHTDAHSAEDVRAHVRTYIKVFATLMVATIVTVGIAQVHLPVAPAVTVALFIAIVKASCVALFFMHLKGESRQIYRVLVLTGIFLVFLFGLPFMGYVSTTSEGAHLWSVQPQHTPAAPEHH
jgi:cytochrome c oxidase subunit 4